MKKMITWNNFHGSSADQMYRGRQDGVVVRTVTSQQKEPRLETTSRLGAFLYEFACSPHAGVGFLQAFWLPHTIHVFD